MGRVRRLGILGGTFNPPHLGHLLLAETARQQLALERVLFLPAGEPPHKLGEAIVGSRHRLAMTNLAIADNPAFVLDNTDVTRPAPHYTATLLPLLAARFTACEPWLLLGGDSLRDLPTWHEPRQVIAQARLAVLPRPGAMIAWEELEEAVPGVRAATTLLDGPSVAISSTQIRAWAAAGRSLRYMLPDAVWAYLLEHRLYRATSRNKQADTPDV